ncbi:hypothetical protein CHARACLAT_032985 [Characodon lateralis]|uniref:Uncharacterized protein n=1 Tax=Characodon lateralis TaxID=208331 RepID=A0ABU7D3B3_9TELE|nr:hypothetical protein [Characodon lateralis]
MTEYCVVSTSWGIRLSQWLTGVMLFKSNDSNCIHSLDFFSVIPYEKSSITNLGVKMDPSLKRDSRFNAVVKSSFFHLRQLSNVKLLLSRCQLETLIIYHLTSG